MEHKLNEIEKQIYDQFKHHTCFELEGTDNDVIYYLHINQSMQIKADHITPYDTIITKKFDKPDNWDDMHTPDEWEHLDCDEFVYMIKDLSKDYEEMLKEYEE